MDSGEKLNDTPYHVKDNSWSTKRNMYDVCLNPVTQNAQYEIWLPPA